jgi:hypothetical protein
MKQLFLLLLLTSRVAAQDVARYTLRFEPVPIDQMIGVQSFAFGKSGDEVVIIGGRIDGLHRRQPWVSFDSAGHNNQLVVLNLKTRQIWKSGLSGCSVALADQLKATNHCFAQVEDTLVLIGGYGIRTEVHDHATFPAALKFSVSELIDSVKKQGVTDVLFQVEKSDSFAVCGGQLQVIGDRYYLVGGHRFDGKYNPRNGPSFTQTYTSGIRSFTWKGKKVHFFPSVIDAELLHKRDYNLVKIQESISTYSFLALSGVFQQNVDLPYQTTTRISSDGKIRLQPGFRQFYNQYECPEVVIFDTQNATNHILMMGGIAQYYDSLGMPVQDDNVPFNATLARLCIKSDGSMEEWLMPGTMPQMLGAGSAFVPNSGEQWKNGIWQWDSTLEDEQQLGYLIGGIVASRKNIFWINEGKESVAVPTVYSVYLSKTETPQVNNSYATNTLNVELLKHGKKDRYLVFFDLKAEARVNVQFETSDGKVIHNKVKKYRAGTSYWKTLLPKEKGVYKVGVTANYLSGDEQQWEQCIVVD